MRPQAKEFLARVENRLWQPLRNGAFSSSAETRHWFLHTRVRSYLDDRLWDKIMHRLVTLRGLP